MTVSMMPSAAGPELARVTVATPLRRIDVALPGGALVADLLPQLLEIGGDGLADQGERHGGWALRRASGVPLDPVRTLATQGVRDGEVLHLVPRRLDWPEAAYDDIVEIIATGARRNGRSWGSAATRACGFVVTAVALFAGLIGVVLSGPPWSIPAGVAFGVAIVLTTVGIVFARLVHEGTAGTVAAGCALPYAFVGGFFASTAGSATKLLVASIALAVFAIAGFVAVGGALRIFVAGILAGVGGAVAALLDLAGVSAAGAAAIIATVAIGALPGYPAVSVWLGRVPVPALPTRPEEILADRPVPRRDDVFAAVARAGELLAGALLGTAIVGFAGVLALVIHGGDTDAALAGTAGAALLLRGRLFAAPAQRLPLATGGATGLLVLAIGLAVRTSSPHARLVLVAAAVVVAAVALTAGVVYSRRDPSPRIGRLADVADVLALVALVPLACGVAGVFSTIADLFGSVGG